MKALKSFYQRHLPHYQPFGSEFHIVFRLAGSIPENTLDELRKERIIEEKHLDDRTRPGDWSRVRHEHYEDYFDRFEALLNGSCQSPRWLAQDEVASVVAEAIHYRDGRMYDLVASTIMPNHVHIVVHFPHRWERQQQHEVVEGRRDPSTYTLTDILGNLKWNTALRCNRLLKRSGAFWQHESYDHVIWRPGELEKTVWYVLLNPVKAGLVRDWEEWKWSYVKAGML